MHFGSQIESAASREKRFLEAVLKRKLLVLNFAQLSFALGANNFTSLVILISNVYRFLRAVSIKTFITPPPEYVTNCVCK